MRLHRFFLDEPIVGSKIFVKDERLLHQWRQVFRYITGAELIVFDGSGLEYDVLISKISNREAELEVVDSRQGIVLEKQITLYQSLIKKDKMEWVVEKATELGVSKVVPVVSERSEKKGFNLERARKIAIEASEQCGRADVPEICAIQNLEITLFNTIVSDSVIVFDSTGNDLNQESGIINYAKEKTSSPNSYFIPHNSCLFVGPEGGWSEKELEMFRDAGAQILSLGLLTLRAETASVVALGKLLE